MTDTRHSESFSLFSTSTLLMDGGEISALESTASSTYGWVVGVQRPIGGVFHVPVTEVFNMPRACSCVLR